MQSLRLSEAHPQALVSLLADTSRALAHAALELGDRGRSVAGLVVARVVEAAPQLEAGRVAGVDLDEPVELRPVASVSTTVFSIPISSMTSTHRSTSSGVFAQGWECMSIAGSRAFETVVTGTLWIETGL